MKIDCVLTAVNSLKFYIDFIPLFIKTWNKLYPNIDVKIIFISDNIPDEFLIYKDNIILFTPIEDIPTKYTSQLIRLLYPCILNYKNGIIITDIDMIPMNKHYFTKNIIKYNNDKFIYFLGNQLLKKKQIGMCYNVATPNTWKDIFKINSLEDIIIFLKKYGKNPYWFLDQITLYKYVMKWNKKTNNLVCLDLKKNSLVRNRFNISNKKIKKNISLGKYDDYHCFRPMNKYSKLNWHIYDLLN